MSGTERSPLGYFYRYDPKAPLGQRLARRHNHDEFWQVGKPEFSIQAMPPEELRHIADLIDACTPPDVACAP